MKGGDHAIVLFADRVLIGGIFPGLAAVSSARFQALTKGGLITLELGKMAANPGRPVLGACRHAGLI